MGRLDMWGLPAIANLLQYKGWIVVYRRAAGKLLAGGVHLALERPAARQGQGRLPPLCPEFMLARVILAGVPCAGRGDSLGQYQRCKLKVIIRRLYGSLKNQGPHFPIHELFLR